MPAPMTDEELTDRASKIGEEIQKSIFASANQDRSKVLVDSLRPALMTKGFKNSERMMALAYFVASMGVDATDCEARGIAENGYEAMLLGHFAAFMMLVELYAERIQAEEPLAERMDARFAALAPRTNH